MKSNFYNITILIFLLFAISFSISAQTETEDFNAFLKQQQQDFDKFNNERQKQFAEFLKVKWENFDVSEGKPKPVLPEPIEQPVAEPIVEDEPVVIIPIEEPEVVEPPKETPLPPKPEKPKPVVPSNQKEINLNFFGSPLTLLCDKTSVITLKTTDETGIADFWSKLADANYANLVYNCRTIGESLQLNDWGYYLLAESIAEQLYPKSMRNEKAIFKTFILDEIGFDVRMGLVNKNEIFVMLAIEEMVFATSYLTIDGKKYFIFDMPKDATIKTYSGDFKKDTPKRKIQLTIDKIIYFESDLKANVIPEKVFGTPINILYNKNMIDYFNTLPQTELSVYFNSKCSPAIDKSIELALKERIEGKSEREALNTILRFTHYAFEYQTDDKQFGYERAFHYEELFAYPYSDCEDRSVLFSYLVRNLMSLPVVGLDYPGHVATAVKCSSEISGDYILYNNEKYLICDPTYIGAVVGQCMPKYKSEKAKIIKLN